NFTGAHFWARGYYVSTVGIDEVVIRQYIQHQEVLPVGTVDNSKGWVKGTRTPNSHCAGRSFMANRTTVARLTSRLGVVDPDGGRVRLWLDNQRGADELLDRPDVIGQPEGHGRCAPAQRLMGTQKVVVVTPPQDMS